MALGRRLRDEAGDGRRDVGVLVIDIRLPICSEQ